MLAFEEKLKSEHPDQNEQNTKNKITNNYRKMSECVEVTSDREFEGDEFDEHGFDNHEKLLSSLHRPTGGVSFEIDLNEQRENRKEIVMGDETVEDSSSGDEAHVKERPKKYSTCLLGNSRLKLDLMAESTKVSA